MRSESRFVTALGLCLAFAAGAAAEELTLQEALARALTSHPALAAQSWEMRIAEARTLQAGLRPNPALSLEIEGIRWRGAPAGTRRAAAFGLGLERDTTAAPPLQVTPGLQFEREREESSPSVLGQAEYTLRLSQLVELGGRRAKRVRLAKREEDTARWDYEALRAAVLADTARAFARLLTAQDRVLLAAEGKAFADEVLRAAALRVEAGQIAPLEQRKAEVEVATAQADYEAALGERAAAQRRLAACWGAYEADFSRAAGHLGGMETVPPLEALLDRIGGNPDVARWTAEVAAREAARTLERARAVPDLELSLGVRAEGLPDSRSESFGAGIEGFSYGRAETAPDRDWDTSLVVEASIALPLFDRNQGNIAAAEHRLSQAADEHRAALAEVQAALAEWWQRAKAAQQRTNTLVLEALPKAQEVFTLTQEGFAAGKFGYLEVLDAQRTLYALQLRLLDAQEAQYMAQTEIEHLVGGFTAGETGED